MSVGIPAALWGLLGLTIPILIHLLSKQKKTVIPFGSIQFLEAQESNSASSIQLSQYALLALRCLILGLICFLMARPYYSESHQQKHLWIENEISLSGDHQNLIDSIPETTIVHPFSYNHDSITMPELQRFSSAWTLVDHLNKQSYPSEVWTYSHQKHFVGKPIDLSSELKWTIIPEKEELIPQLEMHNLEKASKWSINPTDIGTRYALISDAPIEGTQLHKALRLQFIGPEESALKNLITAIGTQLPFSVEWINDTSEVDWIILHNNQSVSDTKVIQYINDLTPLTLQKVGADQYQIKGTMDQDGLLASNLPVQIAGILSHDYINSAQYDRRVWDPSHQYRSPKVLKAQVKPSAISTDLNSYWWIVVLLLIAVERAFSYKSKTV